MADDLDLVRSFGVVPVPDEDVRARVFAATEARLARTRRRPYAFIGVAAAAAVVLVTLAVMLLGRSPARVIHPPQAIPSFPPGWELKAPPSFEGIWIPVPFVGARDVTLAEAERFVGFQIPRPDDPLANDGQIQDVWVAKQPVDDGSTETQIEVVYSTGVYIDLGPGIPSLLGDPQAQLKRFEASAAEDAKQTGGQARVTRVNGEPAYLVPEGAAMWANGKSQGAAGAVTFYLGHEVADVVGHFSNDDLLRIASTVSARPA